MNELQPLIEISRYYGDNPEFVIAGGGNTSFKEGDRIWVKASGIPLAGIGADGFVCLSRSKLGTIETKIYSEDPLIREEEVKQDMKRAVISPVTLRPSVETSLHNLIQYAFVVHTHPTIINAMMCSMDAREEVHKRFGTDALYVEYTDPGYLLFKKLQDRITTYKRHHGTVPQIIFLQNHGVFVGADSVDEIRQLYDETGRRIRKGTDLNLPSSEPVTYVSAITDSVRDHILSKGLKIRSVRSPIMDHFSSSSSRFMEISGPFTPDIIVYCKSSYLFLKQGSGRKQVHDELNRFEQSNGFVPKVIVEEGGGLMVVEENEQALQNVMQLYHELMRISYLSRNFGGPHFMTPEQISFIDSWEVENYRRRVAKGSTE